MQVDPLAEQNDVLFVSGAAATDAVTGINDNTFRSGRQTYQDILAAAGFTAAQMVVQAATAGDETADRDDAHPELVAEIPAADVEPAIAE